MALAIACVVLGWLVTALAADGGSTPQPVVERIVEIDGRRVRLSVFTNGDAVVVIREQDEITFQRRSRLSPSELTVYRDAIDGEAKAIAERGVSARRPADGGWATVTVYRQDGAVQTFGYSPLFGVSLEVGRLTTILDDIERRVVAHRSGEASVRAWVPEVGDRVEMRDGTMAAVVEVRDDGVVVLRHESSPIVEALAGDDVTDRVRRIVETP